jgi:hypothetical protein
LFDYSNPPPPFDLHFWIFLPSLSYLLPIVYITFLLAAKKGHLDAVKELLFFRPTEVEMCNDKKQNALHLSANAGHYEVVKVEFFIGNSFLGRVTVFFVI